MWRHVTFGATLLLVACQSSQESQSKVPVPDSSVYPTRASYLEEWRQIADSLTVERQRVILQNLLSAAEREGWAGAVRYCHAAAETLTFYKGEKIYFQRVALRNRNPKNALADSLDEAAYKRFAETKSKESFIVEVGNGTLRYYRPIYIPMVQCLKCHGKPQDLDGPALAEIRKRYPKDKAVDFAQGDLRGMWKAEIRP
ncbi:MAG: DUF3365 domain-containing protein [Bacteroidia bacterium]|nr:DUF3365 domain-containing protein [Bacteroidia bacterium]